MAEELNDWVGWQPSELNYADIFPGGAMARFIPMSPSDSGADEGEDEDEEAEVEDYMAGLTRDMARFFLLDEEKDDGKDKDVPISPQSTLGAKGVLSPAANPMRTKECSQKTPWRMAGAGLRFDDRQLLYQRRRAVDLSLTEWPPLQNPPHLRPTQQGSSGLHAVFLSSSCKKEPAGTGVFLPRRPGTTANTDKKSSCSTVLLPERVVQALNLNLDELGATIRIPGGFVLHHDELVRRSKLRSDRNRHHRIQQPQHQHSTTAAAAPPPENGLPQEWTY